MKHIHIEGTGKPLKVVASELTEDAQTDLIAGKEYLVTVYWSDPVDTKGWGCIITDENGFENKYIDEFNDFEVVGGSWIVTEREADSN